jgi:Neuraminidase (sialidase)
MKIIDVKLTPHNNATCAKVTFLDEGQRWTSTGTDQDPQTAVRLAIRDATDALYHSLLRKVSIQHTATVDE